MVTAAQAALLLALHRLIAHIEADPDGALGSVLPDRALDAVRHHLKRPADALTDVAVRLLLPLLQPRHLRLVGSLTATSGDSVLDVFPPPRRNGALPPVLLFVHGGIWTLGNRQQYRALGQRLAFEGFVAVIIGYTTWPRATATEQAREVRRAIAYARAHAGEWGGASHRVFVSGQSSGANVSALALLPSRDEAECGGEPACAGLIGMAGPYDLVAHFEHESRRGVEKASMMAAACAPLAAHSPTLIVQRHAQPLACHRVLLLHGEKDITVPPSSSALFALELARVGQHAEYVALPAVTHLSFLLDLMTGRRCDLLLAHLKRFCGLEHGVEGAREQIGPAARL